MEIPNPRKDSRMLIVQLPTKRIGITFRHLKVDTLKHGVPMETRVTHCGIWELPDEDKEAIKLTYGVATCSPKDNFSKEKGRKCALTRALLQGDHEFNNYDLNGELKPNWVDIKESREMIWNAYRNRGESSAPPNPEGAPIVEGVVINVPKLLPESAQVH